LRPLIAGQRGAGWNKVIPVSIETWPCRGRRAWRRLAAVGAVGLIVYGLVNVAISWAVLGGLVTPEGGYDRDAQLGHAVLWDPLFLLWGLLLAGGLTLTRQP
jgi:hypothetical protein